MTIHIIYLYFSYVTILPHNPLNTVLNRLLLLTATARVRDQIVI